MGSRLPLYSEALRSEKQGGSRAIQAPLPPQPPNSQQPPMQTQPQTQSPRATTEPPPGFAKPRTPAPAEAVGGVQPNKVSAPQIEEVVARRSDAACQTEAPAGGSSASEILGRLKALRADVEALLTALSQLVDDVEKGGAD